MYDVCIFDLYGTLVDIHTDEDDGRVWEKLALFYGYYGAGYEPEELKDAYRRIVDLLSGGEKRLRNDSHEAFPEIQIEKVFLRLFEEKGVDADQKLAIHAGQFFRALSTEYIRLYDGTREMLMRLRESGKKIYLLSNAQRIFTEYEMNALGITKYFDKIYISSDCGCKKPDLSFFEKLISECASISGAPSWWEMTGSAISSGQNGQGLRRFMSVPTSPLRRNSRRRTMCCLPWI